MEGGPASLGDRKSHPSFWSWKRCAEPCCCLQVSSLLLISHTPPLPPSSSFPPISGTSFPSPSVSLFFFPQSFSVSCFPPGPPCLRFCLCSVPCGSLPLTCPHSDSPLGVLAHLGGRSLHTLWEVQKFGAVFSPESSSPDDGRTVPRATSVPTAEPGLQAGQRPLEVRLGIAALCRLQLPAGSHCHPRHRESHTCLCGVCLSV